MQTAGNELRIAAGHCRSVVLELIIDGTLFDQQFYQKLCLNCRKFEKIL